MNMKWFLDVGVVPPAAQDIHLRGFTKKETTLTMKESKPFSGAQKYLDNLKLTGKQFHGQMWSVPSLLQDK